MKNVVWNEEWVMLYILSILKRMAVSYLQQEFGLVLDEVHDESYSLLL